MGGRGGLKHMEEWRHDYGLEGEKTREAKEDRDA